MYWFAGYPVEVYEKTGSKAMHLILTLNSEIYHREHRYDAQSASIDFDLETITRKFYLRLHRFASTEFA